MKGRCYVICCGCQLYFAIETLLSVMTKINMETCFALLFFTRLRDANRRLYVFINLCMYVCSYVALYRLNALANFDDFSINRFILTLRNYQNSS